MNEHLHHVRVDICTTSMPDRSFDVWQDYHSDNRLQHGYDEQVKAWKQLQQAVQEQDWMQSQLEVTEVDSKPIIEGVDIMKLFTVYLVYGENRNRPFVIRKDDVIARDAEDAKIKSGVMKEVSEEWDADFLTILAVEIGEVKVKTRPKEVKSVEK